MPFAVSVRLVDCKVEEPSRSAGHKQVCENPEHCRRPVTCSEEDEEVRKADGSLVAGDVLQSREVESEAPWHRHALEVVGFEDGEEHLHAKCCRETFACRLEELGGAGLRPEG